VLTRANVLPLVARYAGECFAKRRAPHIAELAYSVGVSPLKVSRLFEAATRRKLGAFLRTQQVLRARRLLRWSGAHLDTVARASGFETERSFYRAFRRVTGMTPARFRQLAAAERARACRESSQWEQRM